MLQARLFLPQSAIEHWLSTGDASLTDTQLELHGVAYGITPAVHILQELADNLIRLIALEAARAGIPAGDRPVRLKHVDGIVGDRVDQQLKPLIHQMRLKFRTFLDGHAIAVTRNCGLASDLGRNRIRGGAVFPVSPLETNPCQTRPEFATASGKS